MVPPAARILRLLLLLPGGDREKGMREMQQARQQGVLLAGEADFQMHWLYLWYEKKPTRALALLRGLDARYPSNPVFLQRVADIQHGDLNDHRGQRRDVGDAARARASGQVEAAGVAPRRARASVLRASTLELSTNRSAPSSTRDAALTAQPSRPYSSLALAQLHLGLAYDRIGRHDLANDAYTAAIAAAPHDDPFNIRTSARDRLRAQPDARDRRR